MKLIYLVFPIAIVSAFFGLIAFYSLLPPDGLDVSVPVESDSATIALEDALEKRYVEALEKIIASSTWFTNFDKTYLRLDWSMCAQAEETDADGKDSPSEKLDSSCDGLRSPCDGLRSPCDGLRSPPCDKAATDNESDVGSPLGVRTVHLRSESTNSG